MSIDLYVGMLDNILYYKKWTKVMSEGFCPRSVINIWDKSNKIQFWK